MSPELDKKLVEEHPLLFGDRYADIHTTAMCWGFDCGDGWYGIIKEAADKLEPLIAEARKKNPDAWQNGFYRASQVKEKFGTLRFYLSCGTDEMYAITDIAERQSWTTCEECGKPGKVVGRYWLYCRCRKCYQKLFKDGLVSVPYGK